MTDSADHERDQKIRDRAYARWEAEGRPHGRHDDHWHEATREVDTPAEAPAAKKPAAPRGPRKAAAPAAAPAAAAPSAPAPKARKPRVAKPKA